MKLFAEQLTSYLVKQPLLPVYLVSGDELLLQQEAVKAIALTAKAHGFLEHRIFQVETQFDWESFLQDAFTVSLFSPKGFIELRFVGQLPNAAASKALETYFSRLPKHKVCVLVTGKLGASEQKTTWFKAVDQHGAVIPIWPITREQLPIWLNEKARLVGVVLSKAALLLLADYVEGNLFAAMQGLERLKLLVNDGIVQPEDVRNAMDAQAHFSIFDLIDALLIGDLTRGYRIFYALQAQGVEPLFILNLLAKEIRLLASLSFALAKGERIETLLQRIYPVKKQALLRRVAKRFSHQYCQTLIKQAIHVDRVLKGVERENSWQALSQLCWQFGQERL